VKALTLRQPFASLVIAGVKDVENRSRPTKYRGVLAIHAGLAIDNDVMTAHRHLIDDMPAGALIGTVRVIDCVQDSESEWAIPGQWHWILADPRPFDAPIAAKDKLGLWTCDVADMALAAVTKRTDRDYGRHGRPLEGCSGSRSSVEIRRDPHGIRDSSCHGKGPINWEGCS
jgi:hypothetical protein